VAVESYDYGDTFLDAEHLVQSFPEAAEIVFETSSENIAVSASTNLAELPPPPYQLTISRHDKTAAGDHVRVKSYVPGSPGPYPDDVPPQNTVRFTPTQVDAIRAGVNPVSPSPESYLIISRFRTCMCVHVCMCAWHFGICFCFLTTCPLP